MTHDARQLRHRQADLEADIERLRDVADDPSTVSAVQIVKTPIFWYSIKPGLYYTQALQIVPPVTFGADSPDGDATYKANGVPDLQKFTVTGSPSGGTFTFTATHPLTHVTGPLVFPWNCSESQLQTLSDAFWGVGNTVAIGDGWPGDLYLYGTGTLASTVIPIAVAGTNALTGGTVPNATVDHLSDSSVAGRTRTTRCTGRCPR